MWGPWARAQSEGAAVSATTSSRARRSTSPSPTEVAANSSAQSGAVEAQMYIKQYRVVGTKVLPRGEVEGVVYPYLGPGRTAQDVEEARAALEKAYRDNGFQTVSVIVPLQHATNGVVVLQVIEQPVGRLRVKGSRYFDIAAIKKRSVACGGESP